MRIKSVFSVLFFALLSPVFITQEASSETSRFDSYGNLTAEASKQFFQKVKPSLMKAVGDEKYLSEPFPYMFMATGYFRRKEEMMIFINPTFGMAIIFASPTSSPYAVGVTELFKIIGNEPRGEKSNILARYAYLNDYINIFLSRFSSYPLAAIDKLENSSLYRDIETNRVFISDPIMRATNPDVRSCFADFPAEAYAKKIDTKFRAENRNLTKLNFEPVDLIPAPHDDGLLILSDSSYRSLYVFVPLKRENGRCVFSEPKYVIQD